ncbi:MAG: phage tail tip lysozyme [Oscillospiraceae bacterium]
MQVGINLCLGFNRAATEAIMTNIDYESGFNPTKEAIDTNDLPSIGLFQWNGERCDNFKAFCNARSLEYGSVDAQLLFLKHELTGRYYQQYETMLNFADSADGCYDAAYYWASRFEVCSSSYWANRAESAYQYYQNHR